MPRREFTRTVKAQIVNRAMNPNGQIVCEGCGLVLGKKQYNVDHIKPDGLEIDKSQELTAEDGQLLGIDCCHKPKTRVDKGNIARAKRREAKHMGFKRTTSRPLPGGRNSKFKKKISGEVVLR